MPPTTATVTSFTSVCMLADIIPDTGVCALLAGRQIAVFRTAEDAVYAIDNRDPFSGACVLSRGIVGDRDGVPKVASPLYKQSFDLRTGICLDDPQVRVETYLVRLRGGEIQIGVPD